MRPLATLGLALVLLACYAQARPEPPSEGHHHGGYSSSHHGHKEHAVKVKQSGHSKIFGWLGSRFAKIPHYLPKFPSFPKYHHTPSKTPVYQAIILPEPPKTSSYGGYTSYTTQSQLPEKVIITSSKTTYESPFSSAGGYTSIPSAPAAPSYTMIHQSPQIEVVPSTLLYHNTKEIHPQPQQQYYAPQQAQAPVQASYGAPPAKTVQTTSYNQVDTPHFLYTPPAYSSPTTYTKPSIAVAAAKQHTAGAAVPSVPQSQGPDYFDTAYRSPGGAPSDAYGAPAADNSDEGSSYAAPATAQYLDTSVKVGPIRSPIGSPAYPEQQHQHHQQQAFQYAAPQQNQYAAPAASYAGDDENINTFANQALNNQPLAQLISAIDSGFGGAQRQNNYVEYQAPAPQQQYQASQHQQYQAPSSQYQASAPAPGQQNSGIPGVQILSQGTDGGNPVFEVIADANAPTYGGHPFDINKLIAMIEPGATLESADLSHAASETNTSYLVKVGSEGSSDSSAAASAPAPATQTAANRR